MQLLVYHANQCDPKKCSGRKLARFSLVRLTKRLSDLKAFLVLSPFSEKALSPEDLSLIHISEPTRLLSISYAVFCLQKKNNHAN